MADSIAESKANLLESISREPGSFDIYADPDPTADGLYRIWFTREGDPSLGFGFEGALAIADQIRARHPSVADHIVGCVERGRRYAKESHRSST